MDGYQITATVIGLVGGAMAVWQSLRPRVRRTTADEQALNASIRRHPSGQPAHIPGQRRPS